ncbi:hypothetical protein KY330_04720, partial [Candidatus Woesearchaeota archaeon]|nr:hypothetical protein [Candidatus Woesearchaeota archaeon]
LGKGYWIKATRDIAFEVKGTRGILTSDGVEQAPSIQLKQGWNLLGVHSFENVKQVDYLKNIEGKYARLWEYDPSLKTINPISITDVGEFMPSKAYWIYMNEPGVVLP